MHKQLAWDQALYCGKKEKKWCAKPFPPPQNTTGLASLADVFPILPRFLPFSTTVEPGPRLANS